MAVRAAAGGEANASGDAASVSEPGRAAAGGEANESGEAASASEPWRRKLTQYPLDLRRDRLLVFALVLRVRDKETKMMRALGGAVLIVAIAAGMAAAQEP